MRDFQPLMDHCLEVMVVHVSMCACVCQVMHRCGVVNARTGPNKEMMGLTCVLFLMCCRCLLGTRVGGKVSYKAKHTLWVSAPGPVLTRPHEVGYDMALLLTECVCCVLIHFVCLELHMWCMLGGQ